MKLRNKETGEIRKAELREDGIYLWSEPTGDWWKYELELLASGWEYYVVPAEPLIKDEKVRKAVRAWAEANDIRYARKCSSLNARTRRLVGFDALGSSNTIEFEKHLKLYGDPDKIEKDSYTIAELCGEEEE